MAQTRLRAGAGLDNRTNSITNIGVSGSSLTQAGAFALTLTTTAATNATLPSGTTTLLHTTGSGASLTNLNAGNIATGTLAVARGGTGATATVQGGVVYGASTTAYATSAVGTSGQLLQSNGTAAPAFASFDFAVHAPDSSYKKIVRMATTADLAASTFATNVLSGYSQTASVSATTTAGSAVLTLSAADVAKIRAGASTVSTASTAIPAGLTVNSPVTSATTVTLNTATRSIAITNITGDGTTVTVTFAAQTFVPFAVGATITIAGTTAFNGSFAVTASTTTTVTYSAATTGTETTGTISQTISAGTTTVVLTNTIAALAAAQFDGITPATNDRVLIKDQSTLGGLFSTAALATNGIYTITSMGSTTAAWTLTRSADADVIGDLDGLIVGISAGTLFGAKRFLGSLKGTDTLNTTAFTFNRIVDINESATISKPTTAFGIDLAIGRPTVQVVGGNVANLAFNTISSTAISASSASAYTTASSLYIAGAPTAGTNATITNPYALYVVSGVSRFDGRIESLQANNTATGAGQIFLNGATGNRIDFNINGIAAPAFTTRSAGTKVVLYPAVTASAADYALGIDNSTLWYSVDTTAASFKWYGGTTLAATLSGVGSLTLSGGITSNATTQDIIVSSQTTGLITLGGTASTGVITIGQSTAAQNINIGTGNTAAATTATISIGTGTTASTGTRNVNIGTGGAAGSTTSIIIGGTAGTSTSILNGTVRLNTTTNSAVFTSGANGTLTIGTLPVTHGGTGTTTSTGSGSVVLSSSPSLTTPSLGAASATSISATGNLSGSTLTSTVATGTAPFSVTSTTAVANLSIGGNANTATTLQTARTINGTSFNGSANITITANTTNSLTLAVSGTGLSGSATFNGGAATTFTVASNATSANTASTIVARDATNNFSAGTITASLNGNASTATSATNASNLAVTDDTTTAATYYPSFAVGTSGNQSFRVSSTKLTFDPSTGTLTATDINSTSDIKAKTNVQTSSGLSVVTQLRGVTFDWIESGNSSSGVIAQEIEQIAPHLVSESVNGKAVNYSGIIAYLIEGMKEQQKQIEALQQLINK